MQTTILGRTGLTVSRMGVGAGGPSQIGRKTGLSENESADLLRHAFDQGVNFVDTAEGYGTEPIVGQALQDRDRSSIIVSTKKSTRRQEITAQNLQASLDHSLQNLGTDYIDLYNLHGVVPQDYPRLVTDIYPILQKAQDQGKIRFVGLSEMFNEDLGHTMLQMALTDDLWDVLMVGFNLLNQTARENFPAFLLAQTTSLPDAAYRFCRDEPGVHIVLSGTGNAKHLDANLASFAQLSLSLDTRERLKYIFRHVDSTTGQSI